MKDRVTKISCILAGLSSHAQGKSRKADRRISKAFWTTVF